jgi:hypothetical protein
LLACSLPSVILVHKITIVVLILHRVDHIYDR